MKMNGSVVICEQVLGKGLSSSDHVMSLSNCHPSFLASLQRAVAAHSSK